MSFGGWVGSKISKGFNRTTRAVKSIGSQIDDNLKTSGAAYFANPLIAQDIAGAALGGALSRGADPRAAFSAAGNANAALAAGDYQKQDYLDLAAFNAALVAGGTTGALTSGVAYASPLAASSGASPLFAVGGSVLGATAAGAATYAGAQAGANALGGATALTSADVPAATSPPDVNEANDPNTAAQFARIRKAARAMGRAGTIKYKGSGTSLGLGEQVLGDQLALIGS